MSRPYIDPDPIFVNASMASTLHSSPINIRQLSFVGFDINWTGAPVGTFSVEVSNTYQQNPNGSVRVAGNWTALTLSAPIAATGAADNAFIDIDAISASWIRLSYNSTSGTGNLNATLSSKVS